MKKHFSTKSQQGMTLIEIMIAMLISLFIIGGVILIFTSSQQSYRLQENLSRMQENGRFAMAFLSRDIRTANYRKCFSDLVPPVIEGEPSAIAGSDNSGLNNSDSITVAQKNASCSAPDTTATIEYRIQNDVTGTAALFQSTDDDGDGPTASNTQALVEGIENMQILYGEDTDNDNTPNYYVPAGTTGLNMSQVVSVRVSLLIASLDDHLSSTPRAYSYNGALVDPAPDNRIRRVFTSTIALRNQLP